MNEFSVMVQEIARRGRMDWPDWVLAALVLAVLAGALLVDVML